MEGLKREGGGAGGRICRPLERLGLGRISYTRHDTLQRPRRYQILSVGTTRPSL
jgi:hypothetical protein